MKAVSQTAYYCCGVRMQDAASIHPVINDTYAKRLMSEEGLRYWQEFAAFKMPNASNTARHYIIDSYLKELLSARPGSTVILIGAGLDSRAYRFKGATWVEIDEAAVIEYKNEKLPVSECANPLERIPINFETEKLSDKLSPYSNRKDVIIIVEGVLMYLTMAQREALLKTITTLFPAHIVFCDLMSKRFFDKLGGAIHEKFKAHGASFTDMMDDPAALFLQHNYQQAVKVPTIKKSVELGLAKLPKLAFLLSGKLLNGYAVYEFTYNKPL
ncbi:MAG TPA: class I SAM-dependent methyltransferase [Parafilimonas sp.]|nr:class I SAM-dependent methyltransferase [Parafilimonas sp.]